MDYFERFRSKSKRSDLIAFETVTVMEGNLKFDVCLYQNKKLSILLLTQIFIFQFILRVIICDYNSRKFYSRSQKI